MCPDNTPLGGDWILGKLGTEVPGGGGGRVAPLSGQGQITEPLAHGELKVADQSQSQIILDYFSPFESHSCV